jgi:hypothetical protein
MKKFLLGILGLAAATTAHAAVVTYTLSLHEGTNGQFTAANSFAVYVSVSQADNSGLFAYGVDLKGTGDVGGPTTMTLTNRTPVGTWDIDDSDPNYDGGVYSTKYAGFGTGRGASVLTGIVSGVQDLAKGEDLIRLYGFGQNSHRMDDFRPPPVIGPFGPIPYKPYLGASQSDGGGTGGQNPYGNPAVPALLAPGSARLLTGTWTGVAPSIEQLSVNTKASVWKLNTTTDQSEVATLQFRVRDTVEPPIDVSFSSTLVGPNVATGGAIIVTGANGKYSSEVDQLTADALVKGGAPIQTIGDEAGNIYIMLKINGSASDLTAINAEPNAVNNTDSQFALLHSSYDSAFGLGGFNALFRFPNITGPKNINFDFSQRPGVSLDQIAAVPEPTTLPLVAFSLLSLLPRRRRSSFVFC